MKKVKKYLPDSTQGKIWFIFIIAYSFRFTTGQYFDFVFNSYYLLAFTTDFFLNTLFYLIVLYSLPRYLIKKIKIKIPKSNLSFSQYFVLPLRKDWLFISLLASIFVTVFLGTTLLFWWILFFLIRIYFVNKKILVKNSEDLLFISYSTHDQLIVSKIKDRLKENHNIDSWWQKDLLPTDDYENIIKEKIEKSSGSLIMYSNNYEESIPIQEWELETITKKKDKHNDYFLTTCVVGKNNHDKIPFAESLQIIPSRSDSLNRLDTEDFNKEIRLLAKGLSSFVNIRNGISRENYTDPKWFSFIGSFFMLGNFIYDSGLALFIDPYYYQ